MQSVPAERPAHPTLILWIAAGWAGFLILPWYGIEDGFFSFGWLVDGYPLDEDYAPAILLLAQGKKLLAVSPVVSPARPAVGAGLWPRAPALA